MTGTKYGVPSAQLNPATPYANYATYNKLQTFIYDKVGNRQEFDDGTNTYLYDRPAGGGAYTPSNVNEYYRIRLNGVDTNRTYDANGNLTNDGTFVYKWDYKNRLIEVDPAGGGAAVQTNNYNCFDLRIFKTVGTATTYYYQDRARVIETHDGSDNVIASFVFGRSIDEVLTSSIGGTTYSASCNVLGSVAFWSDPSANNVEKDTYDVFGKPTTSAWLPIIGGFGWVTVTDSKVAPFMFTGRESDAAIGDYYYRARYMSPLEGRFTTRDPKFGIAVDLGPCPPFTYFNPYNYVGNAPTHYVDPLGLDADDTIVALECCPVNWPSDSFGVTIGNHCSVLAWCKGKDPFRYQITGNEKIQGDPNSRKSASTACHAEGTQHGMRDYLDQGEVLPPDFVSNDEKWAGKWGDWKRYKVKCTKGKRPCDTYDCLKEAFKQANVPPYNKYGPNSNTFAHALLTKCGCELVDANVEEDPELPHEVAAESDPRNRIPMHRPPDAKGWNSIPTPDYWPSWSHEWGK